MAFRLSRAFLANPKVFFDVQIGSAARKSCLYLTAEYRVSCTLHHSCWHRANKQFFCFLRLSLFLLFFLFSCTNLVRALRRCRTKDCRELPCPLHWVRTHAAEICDCVSPFFVVHFIPTHLFPTIFSIHKYPFVWHRSEKKVSDNPVKICTTKAVFSTA